MKETFIDRRFSAGSLAIIADANQIIGEYQRQGFQLTLRQLYYQFVARDKLPNRQSEYKRLGSIINDARLAGLLDWSAIEDRTRNVVFPAAWSSPAGIIGAAAGGYQENPWLMQSFAPEVWVEKDALVGVVEPACERNRVPFFACRGYASQSEIYSAGKRLKAHKAKEGRTPIVFHLGDHDPSGIDMTRDNGDRLAMFARMGIKVVRLALNRDQIDEYNPPPNPAKDTDARFAGYAEIHGDESWELDALEPNVIDALIQEAVDGIKDEDRWEDSMGTEARHRQALQSAADNWDEVEEFVRRL